MFFDKKKYDVLDYWKYIFPAGSLCYILFFFAFYSYMDVLIGNIQVCLRLLCVFWVPLQKWTYSLPY